MRQCSISGCTNKWKCREWCSTHYKQILSYKTTVKAVQKHHGLSKTREYRIWHKMMERCYNPAHHAYLNYGGRGIKICDRWKKDVSKFVEDMGISPPTHSIDRIDVNGNYEPSNCRWASIHLQAANRRNSVAYPGVNWDDTKKTWKAMLTVDRKVVLNKRFKDYLEAVNARREAEIKYNLDIRPQSVNIALF